MYLTRTWLENGQFSVIKMQGLQTMTIKEHIKGVRRGKPGHRAFTKKRMADLAALAEVSQ